MIFSRGMIFFQFEKDRLAVFCKLDSSGHYEDIYLTPCQDKFYQISKVLTVSYQQFLVISAQGSITAYQKNSRNTQS